MAFQHILCCLLVIGVSTGKTPNVGAGKYYGEEAQGHRYSVQAKASKICASNAKPIITIRPDPHYEVKIGQQAKIVCAASGDPEPYVYWIKGKESKSGSEKRLGPTSVGKSILYFEKLEAEDVDIYTCVVEDCCRGTIQTIETDIVVPINMNCKKRHGSGYKIFHPVWQYKNWTEAKAFCEKEGMILATPKSEQQNLDLWKAINISMENEPNKRKFHHSNMIWLGIGDGVSETDFTDVNTGLDIEYENWMPKQPDNWMKHNKEEGQDCVAMDRQSGKWDDSYAKWERPFACWCPPRVGI